MNTSLYSKTAYPILFSVAGAHFLNDFLQSVFTSVYPVLKQNYALTFSQIGIITFGFQCTASILQPFVGNYTDKRPQPLSFYAATIFTLTGLICLSFASGYTSILLAACLIGVGSSIFHPEASRVAYFASGGRRGLAQSIFQLGGNFGAALSPLIVAVIVSIYDQGGKEGQPYLLWFLVDSVFAFVVLTVVSKWYKGYLEHRAAGKTKEIEPLHNLPRKRVLTTLMILLVLITSKYLYTAGITNYFTFYLMDKFKLSIADSQLYLFIYLGSVATGTLLGGPLGDKFGRKVVIWFSILGAAPFAIALPYCDLFWTAIFIAIIGLVIASAFSAILVYAQELMPGKTGLVSGLFFGFAFGVAGIGAAFLGKVIDEYGLTLVYKICSYLPLLGLVAAFLPNIRKKPLTS